MHTAEHHARADVKSEVKSLRVEDLEVLRTSLVSIYNTIHSLAKIDLSMSLK